MEEFDIIGLTKHGWKNTHKTKSKIDCQTNLNGSVFQHSKETREAKPKEE